MTYKSIDEIFRAFSALKVLIVGDVMLDTYIYGSVTRISPEAPVPVVNISKRESRLGGAANVALNVQALGATPILCTVVGDDVEGAQVVQLLKEAGLSSAGVLKSKNRITTVKNRVISASQHLLRIDSEVDTPLVPEDQSSFVDQVARLISEVDLVIFEDYDKGCLSESSIAAIIGLAQKGHVPTAVDPKKRNFLNYKGCSLFKPNLKELREGMHAAVDPDDEQALREAANQLKDQIHFQSILVTLSEKGIFFQGETNSGLHEAHVRSIADVSGAGDTVISIAGLCLALGLPLPFIAELANLGGGIVCEYQGVLPVRTKRLKEEAINNRILAAHLG